MLTSKEITVKHRRTNTYNHRKSSSKFNGGKRFGNIMNIIKTFKFIHIAFLNLLWMDHHYSHKSKKDIA